MRITRCASASPTRWPPTLAATSFGTKISSAPTTISSAGGGGWARGPRLPSRGTRCTTLPAAAWCGPLGRTATSGGATIRSSATPQPWCGATILLTSPPSTAGGRRTGSPIRAHMQGAPPRGSRSWCAPTSMSRVWTTTPLLQDLVNHGCDGLVCDWHGAQSHLRAVPPESLEHARNALDIGGIANHSSDALSLDRRGAACRRHDQRGDAHRD